MEPTPTLTPKRPCRCLPAAAAATRRRAPSLQGGQPRQACGPRPRRRYSAPVLVALAFALLAWALSAAGGPGPLLSAPGRLTTPGQLWAVFLPALTANISYWATLALNIPDFSRCGCVYVWLCCVWYVGFCVFCVGGCTPGRAVHALFSCRGWRTHRDPPPPPRHSPTAATPSRSARSWWARRWACRPAWRSSRLSASRSPPPPWCCTVRRGRRWEGGSRCRPRGHLRQRRALR